MKFTKEVIVSRTYELTPEEFVNNHLREIRVFREGDKVEYDLFVQCGVNTQFLTHAVTIPEIDFDVNDFDRYARTPEERKAHADASLKLIALLNKHFNEEK